MPIDTLGLTREQVLTSPIDCRARAHDASHFLLYPRVVAVPHNADDVARLLRGCSEAGVGVTFRSGGTSLSGQAGTDAVLADVRRYFDGIEILDEGMRVRVQPGVTVNRLNAHLAAYGRAIGPDPASSAACTIGGVIANNSSGMACGTVENSYRTLESMVVVLASGTVIDTGSADADEKLRTLEPELHRGLFGIRERLMSNPSSVSKINQQFSMKNTMGYGLNSFLDYATPAEILAHVMVGSEGTLGFVASAVFRTIPVRPYVQTGLLVFEDMHAANRALPDLVATGAATLELMDTASIRVGQALANCPKQVSDIHPASQAALLLEYQSTSQDEIKQLVSSAQPILASLPVQQPVTLTADPRTREELWSMRKGLYTAVAAARRPGTTALLEDVVVPVESLADTCVELAGLFDEFSYRDSVIFGHAKDGNIHFMITDEFDRQLDRYERFTNAMVDVVLGRQGSLKAEHGTGRVMAPFVRTQYGDELYEVMCQVKEIFDPQGMLNDGVVITDDPKAHLKHIKSPVALDPMVDACVECGYCEPVCPARTLTLTPRQRIVTGREINQAYANGDVSLARELEKAYVYDGIHTCAVDGMCVTACPVGINTGLYIKQRRAEAAAPIAQAGWALAAGHWAGATHMASFALSTASRLKPVAPIITAANQVGRTLVGDDILPLWSPDLPAGGRSRRRPHPTRQPAAVYIPACVNSMFGPGPSGGDGSCGSSGHGDGSSGHGDGSCGSGVQSAFETLCARVGLSLVVPDNIDSLCCATPWTSKGMTRGRDLMTATVVSTVRECSDNGRLPIVCDASSCTEGLQRMLSETGFTVIDAVQFVAEHILPLLSPGLSHGDGSHLSHGDGSCVTACQKAKNSDSQNDGSYLILKPKLESITLHETCSSTQIGLNPYLISIAEAVADTVNVPLDTGCCAFAGDRGMLHPELTHAATRPEAAEVDRLDSDIHASCNRTCEIGMTRATGKPYLHILEVLADQLAE